MTAQQWMPEAEHYDLGDHAPTDAQYPPKVIAHATMDALASKAHPIPHVSFERLVAWFTGGGRSMAPHIVWDPFTGQFAQFYPASSRSKSVVDAPGGTRTNRAGRVVIQVEAVFFPYTLYGGKVYATLEDTPCKGWAALHAWIKSHNVPDEWPNGRPEDCTRDEHTWETEGGYYPHKGTPENNHTDPGTWPAFPAATAPKPKPPLPARQPRPFPTGLRPGASNPSARGLQRALQATGWLSERVELSDNYGPQTQAAVAGFNRKHHLNSAGVTTDSAIGKQGWKLLMTLAYGAA
jgi:hypothetical protein